MTTIAYAGGVMASDSKCTDANGAFLTRCKKIYRLPNGALVGTAGDADARELLALLGNVRSPKNIPTRGKLAETKTDFRGIMVFPRGQVFYIDVYTHDIGSSDSEWTAQIVECAERFAAVGSGEQFAIGALAAGRSAAQAVAIACRYDSYSAQPIHKVALKT